MDDRIKSAVIVTNYSIILLSMIFNSIYNSPDWLPIMFLYFVFLVSYSFRTFFLYRFTYEYSLEKRRSLIILLTYAIDILLILLINSLNFSLMTIVLFLLLLEDLVLNQQKTLTGIIGLVVLFTTYSTTVAIHIMNGDTGKAIAQILISLPVFLVVYIIFFLIHYLLRQTEIIESALKDITVKKLEKDVLYNDLRAAYERVEGMAALKERNKIAREIHDTVGHTLTTVLVEIEAGKRLIQKDGELALTKLNLAQSQVRKGLNEIRSSVRMLEKGEDILNFQADLASIIAETEKHSEVAIQAQIDEDIKLTRPQEKVILSALLEGLANGIRHGKSTAFLVKLLRNDQRVIFSLEDNGMGAHLVTPGFGLRAMKERISELEGTLEISSRIGEGFALTISLPYSANREPV